MKTILATLALTFATSSFAGVQYVCKQVNDRPGTLHTMTLTQVSTGRILEGNKYAFNLELREIRTRRLVLSERVTVETEDVMFSFSNKAKAISGMIYLDEMDGAWLNIGRNELRFDCQNG